MRKSECGLRPVGVIGAYAPEGMRNDGVAALCLFNLKSIECLPSIFSFSEFLSRSDWPIFRPEASLV
jgi:hypothetical protein